MKKSNKKTDELLQLGRERARRAYDYVSDNWEEAREDLEFAIGEGQWTEQAKELREGRPMLTINRMPQFVHQVVNDIKQSNAAIKVSPAGNEASEDTAEIYQGLIRDIERSSDSEQAYFQAAENSAYCGEGAFRILTEYVSTNSFDQKIIIEPIQSSFAVLWSSNSRKKDGSDADYCFVTERMPLEEFERKYPDASNHDFEQFTTADYSWWVTQDAVRVAEYFYKEQETVTLGQFQGGIFDITGLKKDKIQSMEQEVGKLIRTRESERDVIYRALINGVEVLEGPTRWPGVHIPVVRVVGEEVYLGDRCYRHGVIRFARDPQRMYNYWRSSQTEMIALQPKQPWLIDGESIAGYEKYWRDPNNAPYLPWKSASGAPKPERMMPPQASTGMNNEIMLAAEDMKATTGIYDAGLGARSNEVSGIAIQSRQRESDIGTFTYQNNLNLSIERCGEILVDLIPKIYDTERVVRVIGVDDTEDMETINTVVGGQRKNDLSMGDYTVAISTGASYSTKRMEAAANATSIISAAPGVLNTHGDLLFKSFDWPMADQIAERFAKMLPPNLKEHDKDDPQQQQQMMQQAQQQQQQQQQLQERMMMLEFNKKQLELEEIKIGLEKEKASIMKLKSEASENVMDAQKTQAETQKIKVDTYLGR